jgi:superoxide dismutase
MRDIIQLLEEKSKPTDIEPINLSWSESALSPVLTSGNVRQHKKLWQGYCDRFNSKQGDTQFQYAGYLLHNLYFSQFRAPRTNNPPNGPIGNLIRSKYKDWDNFREKFKEAALKFHGSGWVYLARDGSIKTIPNHQIRSDVAIIADVWEHAYMSDYSSNKAKYLDNIWKIMDWNSINTRYMAPYK